MEIGSNLGWAICVVGLCAVVAIYFVSLSTVSKYSYAESMCELKMSGEIDLNKEIFQNITDVEIKELEMKVPCKTLTGKAIE